MDDCTYFDAQTTVQGELTTSSVIVEGSFEGEIHAKEKILLRRKGHLQAVIYAQKVMIEEGATFDGTIILDRQSD